MSSSKPSKLRLRRQRLGASVSFLIKVSSIFRESCYLAVKAMEPASFHFQLFELSLAAAGVLPVFLKTIASSDMVRSFAIILQDRKSVV